jgi:RNA polymerase-binding transcription factor DksA
MLPDVLPQLNKAQLDALKNQPVEKKKKIRKEVEGIDEGEEGEVEESESDSDDDIPELVGQNFESVSKQD